MREYIVRTSEGEEFDIPLQMWSEVLRPKSFPSDVIDGKEILRLRVVGCEVSFFPEPSCTQIVFECDGILSELADQIVKEIVENAESFTGKKGVVIPLQ